MNRPTLRFTALRLTASSTPRRAARRRSPRTETPTLASCPARRRRLDVSSHLRRFPKRTKRFRGVSRPPPPPRRRASPRATARARAGPNAARREARDRARSRTRAEETSRGFPSVHSERGFPNDPTRRARVRRRNALRFRERPAPMKCSTRDSHPHARTQD